MKRCAEIAITKHYLYPVYNGMRCRCYRVNHKSYFRYGGRGIKMCSRWIEPDGKGFWNFVEDMGGRPENCTLDRIDNNSDYSKANCKWSNMHEQHANRHNNNNVVGVHFHKLKNTYIAELVVNKKKYTKSFKQQEDAINYRKELEKLYL